MRDGTTSCRGPRLECKKGGFMDFELAADRPGWTFFDWLRELIGSDC